MTARSSFVRLSTLACLSATSLLAHATPVVSSATQFNSGFAVSSTDLLQTNLGSVSSSGNFSREGEQGLPALTDGSFGTQGNQGNGGAAATADASNVLTYRLDGGTNGTGWDIGSVTTFAGWDRYRGGQSYTLSYSTVAAPTMFINLATVVYDVSSSSGSIMTNSRVLITDSSGFLATNVDSLRFTFAGTLGSGYYGYREIDVAGQASAVPEPSSLLLGALALGLMGGMAALRRPRD